MDGGSSTPAAQRAIHVRWPGLVCSGETSRFSGFLDRIRLPRLGRSCPRSAGRDPWVPVLPPRIDGCDIAAIDAECKFTKLDYGVLGRDDHVAANELVPEPKFTDSRKPASAVRLRESVSAGHRTLFSDTCAILSNLINTIKRCVARSHAATKTPRRCQTALDRSSALRIMTREACRRPSLGG